MKQQVLGYVPHIHYMNALYETLMLFPVTTDNCEILPYQTHYTSNYTLKLKNTRKNKVNHKCGKFLVPKKQTTVLQAYCLFASFQNFVIDYVGKNVYRENYFKPQTVIITI